MANPTIEMPPMDLRTGTPTDSYMGEKPEAALPEAELPVYRGENAKAKGKDQPRPITPEQMATMIQLLRQMGM